MIYQSKTGSTALVPPSRSAPLHLLRIIRVHMRHVIAHSLAGACLLLVAASASATTLLGMDIDQLSEDAEFIFEGEVILSETRQDNASGIISTYITFSIIDVMKGDYSAAAIELKFMGGAFNGQVVQVSGLKIPELGEEGIYFVESTSRDLINPLLGWSQGHFIIVDDDGVRRISTADSEPVTDVQSVAGIPAAIKKPPLLIQGGGDTAAGVSTLASPLMIRRALSVDEFKARIQGLLESRSISN